jgi:transcription initiation factor TFIIIB Brf1 subunit/transcription initiation factor TFIIB
MRYKAVEKLIPILAKEYGLTEYVPTAMNLLQQLKNRYWAVMSPDDYEGALALLYLSAVMRDPLKIFDVQDPSIYKAMRHLANKLGISFTSVSKPSVYARSMGEPEDVVKMVEQLEEKDLPHATLRIKTAALVYIACKMLGRNVFQKDIAKKYGVNPMSIMRYKKLLREKKIIDF